MAPRWQLNAPAYLSVPDTFYMYSEIDERGRNRQRVFNVPRYLDPRDKADHNYPGVIVVTHDLAPQSEDYPFLGEPSADMEPLNDEARAITAPLREKWAALDAAGATYGDKLAESFALALSKTNVPSSPLGDLEKQIAELTAENASLRQSLTPAVVERRL